VQITECLRLNTSLKKYLDISEGKFLNYFINFRMCNNYLPVEKGRLYKQDLINRKCRLCNLNEIGDDSIIYLSGIFLQTTFISNRLCRTLNVMNTKSTLFFQLVKFKLRNINSLVCARACVRVCGCVCLPVCLQYLY